MTYTRPPYNSFAEAIRKLAPGCSFSLTGNDYRTIVWNSPNIQQPAIADIDNLATQLENELPMKQLKQIRNDLLAQSDWTQTADQPDSIKNPWAVYRQALRNLPQSSSPYYNDNQELQGINWPQKP